MANKKQKWSVGDVFLIPLSDGSNCVGLIVGQEREALNSVAIAIFDTKGNWGGASDLPALADDLLFSAVLATRDLLDSGRWAVVGKSKASASDVASPYGHLREVGFVGAKIRGSGIVESFVNAFYGLEPWDDWYVPDYLDGFLTRPDRKPNSRLVFCGRHGTGAVA